MGEKLLSIEPTGIEKKGNTDEFSHHSVFVHLQWYKLYSIVYTIMEVWLCKTRGNDFEDRIFVKRNIRIISVNITLIYTPERT